MVRLLVFLSLSGGPAMSDITIPAAVAKDIADYLRDSGHRGTWLDLLDPPPPSLRGEVARLLEPLLLHDTGEDAREAAGDVLAVVRRHVEALHNFPTPDHTGTGGVDFLARDDVLRLLKGGDE